MYLFLKLYEQIVLAFCFNYKDKIYKYMEKLTKTDIGLIGLAVMGENLALNMADKGWMVSVYNRTVPRVE